VPFIAASGVSADPPVHEPDPAVADAAVAFGRVCLVSLRDEQHARPGRREYASDYRGRRVWFASAEHLRRFEENPRHYWPVLDGCCAVSVVDEGVRRAGTPQFALEYRDRVWLFADRERQERFFQKAADYTARLVARLERPTPPEPAAAAQPEGWTPTQAMSDRR
jgi:YHS domain-containing protein